MPEPRSLRCGSPRPPATRLSTSVSLVSTLPVALARRAVGGAARLGRRGAAWPVSSTPTGASLAPLMVMVSTAVGAGCRRDRDVKVSVSVPPVLSACTVALVLLSV